MKLLPCPFCRLHDLKLDEIHQIVFCNICKININLSIWNNLSKSHKTLLSKWISVEDRLPERKFGIFLCVIEDGGTCILLCSFSLENKTFYHGKENLTPWVTHWMPLPKLPEKK